MKSAAHVEKRGKRKPRKGSVPAAVHSTEPIATDSFSSGVVDNPKSELPQAIRILIVDDHPLFRHGLAQLINSDDGYSICGEASSAPEAMALVRKLRPKLAIVDLGLKGPSGIELTKSLRFEFPKMPILVLSMHDEPTYAVRSLRAGANGLSLIHISE